MKVSKRSVKSNAALAVFARVQTLTELQTNLRKMAKTRIPPSTKPIMSPALEEEIEAALMQYTHAGKWTEWGMDALRKNGNMVLLYGPPGTGKTTIALYMSKRIGAGMTSLNMKDVGGKAPGQTERMVAQTFTDARLNGNQTIFMDECEAIVWDRNRAGSDSMWMVGVIDEILMQIANYPGLIVAATNKNELLDEALVDRCFASLQVGMPTRAERIRLWKQKLPPRFPFQFTTVQLEDIAEHELSGRQIVNAIVREASRALAAERRPTFNSLYAVAEALAK